MSKEIQVSSHDGRPLVVGGARELAAVLRRELGKDAKPGGVRQSDDPRGGAVFVYVLTHDPSEDDEQALKRARRARVPIVAVAAGRPIVAVAEDIDDPRSSHATDIVGVGGAGEGFPLDAIAQVIAARLGEDGAPLAARVPVLRGAVCDVLIASASRRRTASSVRRSSSRAPICPCSCSPRCAWCCGSSRPTGSMPIPVSGRPSCSPRSPPASASVPSRGSCSGSFR